MSIRLRQAGAFYYKFQEGVQNSGQKISYQDTNAEIVFENRFYRLFKNNDSVSGAGDPAQKGIRLKSGTGPPLCLGTKAAERHCWLLKSMGRRSR